VVVVVAVAVAEMDPRVMAAVVVARQQIALSREAVAMARRRAKSVAVPEEVMGETSANCVPVPEVLMGETEVCAPVKVTETRATLRLRRSVHFCLRGPGPLECWIPPECGRPLVPV